MSLFEDVMSLAVQMPMDERERLARALGLSVHTKGPGKTLPLNQFVSQPQSASNDPAQAAAWRARETGHAVVDVKPAQAETAPGAPSLRGLWSDAQSETNFQADSSVALASSLPRNSPVIVHSDVCFALAHGDAQAENFWADLPVEPRLATATYLTLLAGARSEDELKRVQKFVQPFAVLSLGPMASSRAVELISLHGLNDKLQPLDALIAATALAHEIPLVARNAAPFRNVMGLKVVRAF